MRQNSNGEHSSLVIPIRTAGSNAYLIRGREGPVLVDTCRLKNARHVLRTLHESGYSPADIRLIVITHVHYDHVSGLSVLQKLSGAPVLVHEKEMGLLEQGNTRLPAGANGFADWLSKMGNQYFPGIGKFTPSHANLVLCQRFDLVPFGVDGYVLSTPGHTAGSVSVVLNEGSAIVGDSCIYAIEDFVLPPFANDLPVLLETWRMLAGLNCHTYWPGHGKPIPHRLLVNSIDLLIERIRKRSAMQGKASEGHPYS